jgi:hypothetical protein
MIETKPWGFVETIAEDDTALTTFVIKRFSIDAHKSTELIEISSAEIHVLALAGFAELITLDGEGIDNLDKQFKHPQVIGKATPSLLVTSGNRFRLVNPTINRTSVMVIQIGKGTWKTITDHKGTLISE